MREAQGGAPASVENQVLSPGAGATIATLTSLGGGIYVVAWTVQLIGAAAAADQDNFKLVSSSGLSVPSLNPGAAGVYPQDGAEAGVGIGGSISVQAIAAGTVGVTYAAQITVQPSGNVVAAGVFQDGNNDLAETSASTGGFDTQITTGAGIHVRNRINFHPLSGLMAGVAYVRYAKLTG